MPGFGITRSTVSTSIATRVIPKSLPPTLVAAIRVKFIPKFSKTFSSAGVNWWSILKKKIRWWRVKGKGTEVGNDKTRIQTMQQKQLDLYLFLFGISRQSLNR